MLERDKKIYIIHNKENPANKIDGSIDMIGDINNKELLHSTCLLEYAIENYKDINIFKKLNYRHSPEVISYFYTLYKDIVFLNTQIKSNKILHKNTAVLLMPESVSEKQKEKLYELVEQFHDYELEIMYNLSINGGILDGKELYTDENNNIVDIVDNYFKIMQQDKMLKKKS